MDHKFLENANSQILNELSARLPFGVKIHCKWYGYREDNPTEDIGILTDVDTVKGEILVKRLNQTTQFPYNRCGCTVKPYLRSLTKMTAEEEKEYDRLFPYDNCLSPRNVHEIVEWYYKHHIDFYCWIEKGLALEAPDGMYDSEEDEHRKEMYEESLQVVVDSYTNVFNRKYKNLPTIKGDELHRFKNFLNTVQQTFGLKHGVFEKQEELFENLARLFALWGANNLNPNDEEPVARRRFTKSEKKHRNPDRIYPEGTRVVKFSGKPFKSGEHINTVKDVIEHPNKIDPETDKGVPAYTFYEDDSIVECARCTYAETIPVKL